MMESIRTVFTPSNVSFMMEGLKLALLISVGVVILSIIFGTVLGLLRNYEKKYSENWLVPTSSFSGIHRYFCGCFRVLS